MSASLVGSEMCIRDSSRRWAERSAFPLCIKSAAQTRLRVPCGAHAAPRAASARRQDMRERTLSRFRVAR
eukprot:13291154-Alexandrium_andersonii.AAC.1